MSRTRNWLPWLCLAAVYLSLVVISWKRWANPIVDCGREMYVPWQIAEGKMLYRDLFFMYGPLVPYWHALLFKIFGVHLNVLYAVGLILVATQASLVMVIARRVVTNWLAVLAAGLFLVQFAIRPTLGNLVFPYSFNADYACTLNLLALWLVLRHREGNLTGLPLVWAGVCIGLSLLSKPEIGWTGFLFLAVCVPIRAFRRASVASLTAAVIIPLAGYGWFAMRLGAHALLFEYLWPREVLAEMHFYHEISVGTIFHPKAVLYLLSLIIFTAGGLLLAALLAHAAGRRNRWFPFGIWTLLAAFALTSDRFIRFVELNQIHAANILVLLIALWSRRRQRDAPFWIAIFAICSTARAPLFAGLSGYSAFYMAGGVILFVWLWTEWVPSVVSRIEPFRWRVQISTALLILVLVQLGRHLTHFRAELTYPIATPRGEMIVHKEIGPPLSEGIEYVQTRTAPDIPVLFFPEETSLYFLCDRRSPSKYYQFAPGLLSPESKERQLIADADAAAVRHVFVSNRATSEYGKPYFGLHYHTHVRRWIVEHFRLTRTIGNATRSRPPPPPSRYWPSDGYGIEVWER